MPINCQVGGQGERDTGTVTRGHHGQPRAKNEGPACLQLLPAELPETRMKLRYRGFNKQPLESPPETQHTSKSSWTRPPPSTFCSKTS